MDREEPRAGDGVIRNDGGRIVVPGENEGGD